MNSRFWNCCAVYLVRRIPRPSIRASRTPPIMAEPIIVSGPPAGKHRFHVCPVTLVASPLCSFLLRDARMAPVRAPLLMEFQGSSLPLRRTRPQSIVEKSPPHTAKLPGNTSLWAGKTLRNVSEPKSKEAASQLDTTNSEKGTLWNFSTQMLENMIYCANKEISLKGLSYPTLTYLLSSYLQSVELLLSQRLHSLWLCVRHPETAEHSEILPLKLCWSKQSGF